MGFRDAQGRITDKSKKLIEAGKFTHCNGSIYETYRIARTEVMRMNAFAKYEQFLELKKQYSNVRLKLKATLDGRERTQSKAMDGFVSTANGMYMYPDGKYYRLGTAPAQWCINDREVQYIVFLTDKEEKANKEVLKEEEYNINFDNSPNNINKVVLNNNVYTPVSSIKEAELFAENNGVKIADFSKMTLEQANTINKALLTIPKDTRPDFISSLSVAINNNLLDKPSNMNNIYGVSYNIFSMKKNRIGKYVDLDRGVAYNTTTFKSFKAIEKSKVSYNELWATGKMQNKKLVGTKWQGKRWHFNTKGEATIYHELAHCYEKKKSIPQGFESLAKRWYNESNLGQIETVSEAWAEAFAGYYTNNPELPIYIKDFLKGLKL